MNDDMPHERHPPPGLRPLTRLKGAPRGLLLHYILRSISVKPRYGYEILQDIEGKTEGSWRPGVGSVYPILKRLVADGYIKAEETEGARRAYSITPKGAAELKNHTDMFASSWQRWMAMRRLYLDLLEPAGVSNMFIEGSRKQFEMAKELFESRKDLMPRSDLEFMLREYSLNLERQLDWTRNQLRATRPKAVASRVR
jgi:DNA-binding PadR family transcriptional regulator